ncbi:hypothetical protein MBLNU230_g3304t1 [Neophaeotheca triangularis]
MATFAKSTFSHASYAAFRPSYPASLYNTILAHHQGPQNLCLDLGSGTGIATRALAPHFTNILGIDPSDGMVSQARSQTPASNFPGVEYRQGTAEDAPKHFFDGSVDCIVAGQAAHWFDLDRVWPEVSRVLRSKGTVAFWGYKDHVFVDFPKASEVQQRYAYGSHPDLLGSYWPQPGRRLLQDQLRHVKPPGEAFEDVKRVEYEPGTRGRVSGEGTLFMDKELRVGDAMEYVRTWSSYHGWREAHPGREAKARGGEGDVVDEMFETMAKEEGEVFRDVEARVQVEWGSALVMARKR